MFWIGLILGIAVGAAAVILYNVRHPETVDKLSAKAKEKL